jgi:hypothetical protein
MQITWLVLRLWCATAILVAISENAPLIAIGSATLGIAA